MLIVRREIPVWSSKWDSWDSPNLSHLIKQFISYLISNESEFKKQEIAKVLNISRAKLYRKLNGEDG